MRHRGKLLFGSLSCIVAGIVLLTCASCMEYSKKHEAIKAAAVERQTKINETVRAYVHSWNVASYTNRSSISFHANINSDGHYVFTIVNVKVDFSSDMDLKVHEQLAHRVRDEWKIITGSNLIRFFDPDGNMIIWTDLKGKFFSEVPEKDKVTPKKKSKSGGIKGV